MPIITTAQYKTYAGITGTAQDAQLNVIIPALQDELEIATGRKFDAAAFVERIDGADSPTLGVRNYPINSVASVTLINRAGTVVTTYASTGYKIEGSTGLISRQCGGFWGGSDYYAPLQNPLVFERAPEFPDGWRNIEVSYNGGYADVDMPPSLKLLMYDLTTTTLANAGVDQSMESEHLGHYSYKRGNGDIWVRFASRVNAWKRVAT